MAFEQLMAEATAKREKKEEKKKEKPAHREHRHMFHHRDEKADGTTTPTPAA